MKTNVQRLAALLLCAVLVVAAGCTASSSPTESLKKAMDNMDSATSYRMHASLGIDELDIPLQGAEAAGAGYIAAMLKGATLEVDGVYRKEPMRTDIDMKLALPGDMAITLNVPIIMTDDKLYVKVPQIPMLQLPEAITGKFIMIDVKELEQSQGLPSANVAQQQKLVQDIGALLVKHFDEKTYIRTLKEKEAGLPEGVEADKIVQLSLNKENADEAMDTIVKKLLPEMCDLLLANEEYMKSLQTTKEEVEGFKKQLTDNPDETIATLKESLKLNELSLTTAIHKDYISYQAVKLNADVTDPDQGTTAKLGLHFNTTYTDVNKPVEFKNEIPTDVVTLDQLTQLMMAPTGL